MPTIGALLGHSLPQTTARYSHLFDDPLRRATELAGAILSGAKPADVVPLNKRGAAVTGRRRKVVYVPAPGGKAVHLTNETISSGASDMALLEQLNNIKGPVFIARFLAERLRDPSRYPGAPGMVARLLDPDEDATFKLQLVRRRRGKGWTTRVNALWHDRLRLPHP